MRTVPHKILGVLPGGGMSLYAKLSRGVMANDNGRKVWTFDKCPACGSKSRIAENVARREQKAGRLGTDFHPVLHEETTVIADPRRVIVGPTSVPAVVASYDDCLDCGCHYAVRLELRSAMLQPQPPAALGGRG